MVGYLVRRSKQFVAELRDQTGENMQQAVKTVGIGSAGKRNDFLKYPDLFGNRLVNQ